MPETLYIIDGHAHIYASFYAISHLRSPSGEPTNATYGFCNTLIKIIREKHPTYLAVAMDAPGPTFRHQLFSDYKATRKPIPEELLPQLNRIDELLKLMRIVVLSRAGYEADDIIATLTQEALRKNLQVVLCSRDKDLAQLLGPGVVMYDTRKDEVIDADTFRRQWSIPPQLVPQMLALMGDSIDNIPGIPGVGPKTAAKLIGQYGNLDAVVEAAREGKIKGKLGENIRRHAEVLQVSRKLTRLEQKVPLELNWDAMRVGPHMLELNRLQPLLRQLGFERLIQQLKQSQQQSRSGEAAPPAQLFAETPPPVTVGEQAVKYELLDNKEKLYALLRRLTGQQRIAIDTETTHINPMWAELVGISLAFEPGLAFYLPVRGPAGSSHLQPAEALPALKPVLENPKIAKCGQNIKYDICVLRNAGIELAGVTFDTMVASYVLHATQRSHSLETLARNLLGVETIKLHDLIGTGKKQITFDAVPLPQAVRYACEDADLTFRLWQLLESKLRNSQMQQLFEQLEMPLVEVLAEMEYNGVAIDTEFLQQMSEQLGEQLQQLADRIYQAAGCVFNIDSPRQLAEVLFDHLALPVVRKTRTGRSTDAETLSRLRDQHPIIEPLLQYRQLVKLKSTYLDALGRMVCPRTGRLHASFNQTVTATGRLSSSDPNLQNIPIRTPLGRKIRRAFVPGSERTVLLTADYSQIELRILAHLSADPVLRRAFAEEQDIHTAVAAEIFGVPASKVSPELRSRAKAVNFGIIYGQSPYGLSRSVGISVAEARRFINSYFNRYPRVREFLEHCKQAARRSGYVQTIMGHRREIPEINSRNDARRAAAERVAINTVVQGSAADLIKIAMINIHRRIKRDCPDVKMLLQVHDELLFELPRKNAREHEKWICEQMSSAIKLDVPLVVDSAIGSNWLQAKGG